MKLFYITLLALFAVICCYDDLMRYGKITNTIIPRNPTTLSNVSYGCQTFLTSNLYLAGQTRSSVLFKGKVFQATTSTRISKLQLNLNIKTYCNGGQDCNIPKTCTFNGGGGICTIGAMSVLLVVARAGYDPHVSAISPATGNNLTPNIFFNTETMDYVSLSGPLYQFPNDVIYAKTFHLDNENTYELNYCNSIDERVKEIKLDAGDRIFLLIYYTTNYGPFQANSRMLFNGNFNWELAYP